MVFLFQLPKCWVAGMGHYTYLSSMLFGFLLLILVVGFGWGKACSFAWFEMLLAILGFNFIFTTKIVLSNNKMRRK